MNRRKNSKQNTTIPEEIKHKMKNFNEINLSGFIRKAIIEKTRELEWKEKIKQRLKKEESLNQWALDLQKKARITRVKELKKKGLLQ